MPAFVANTNILDLVGLKSAVQDQFIDTAIVEVTVVGTDGNEVAGADWPLRMEHVNGSDGTYRAVLSHELALEPYQSYVAHIDVFAGPDRVGRWTYNFVPQTRFK